MIMFLRGLAIFLTLTGALLFWGARVLAAEGFYRDASLMLLAALLCAVLAMSWPGGPPDW